MWPRVYFAAFLTLLLAIVGPQPRAQFNGCQPGFCAIVPVSGFQGLGDIVSGALGYWGTEAYSAAKRGTKAINVCNVSDVACADMSTDATTGKLVLTTVGGSDCTMVTCTIKTYYDQSGALACSSAACDMTQATIASRATLSTSALNGISCGSFASANSQAYANTTGFSQAQPFSASAVVKRTANFTTASIVLSNHGVWEVYFFNSANTIAMFVGTAAQTASATDSAFHAIQWSVNGASSSFYVDGTQTAVGSTPGSASTSGEIDIGFDTTGDKSDIVMCEVAFYPSNTTSNQSALNTNQHSIGRWNF